jgi:hypothetical protein
MQLLVIQFTIKMFHNGVMQVLILCMYSAHIPHQHNSNINIQTVYTATTQPPVQWVPGLSRG